MQGAALTLVIGSGTLGRAVTPFWREFNNYTMSELYNVLYLLCISTVVESYELTGRHTYFAMGIIAGCALVLLLSLAALYKKLAPKSEYNLPISATSTQVAPNEQESTGRAQ